MSDFFEPPEPPEPPPPRPPRVRQPWERPPGGVLPGVVPVELVVARNERAVASIRRISAYTDGFEFDLLVLAKAPDDAQSELMHIGGPLRRRRWMGGTDADAFKFGIQFSDGRKATTSDPPHLHELGEGTPPPGPVLRGQGGGGSDRQWRQEYWVWPLPPAGPLTFACECARFGIEFTKVSIDAQLVIDAAGRAERVFEDADDATSFSASSGIAQIIRRVDPPSASRPEPPAGGEPSAS